MTREEAQILIIGGGPAGMAAALAAAERGVKVLIVERGHYLGGILSQCIHEGFGLIRLGKALSGPEYAEVYAKRVLGNPHITVMPDTMVLRVTPEHQVYCASRNGMVCFEAKAVVFATGCRERTRGALMIPGTRPTGIFTAGLAQQLLNIHNIAIGKRAVILGSGDIGMIMARRLTLSGCEVIGVFEKLPYCSGLPRNQYQCLDDYAIPLYLSRTVTEIRGKRRLESVVVSRLDETEKPIPGSDHEIPCDTLVLSVGLIPENELAGQAGIVLAPETNGIQVDSHLEASVPGMFACGNALHVNDLVDNVSDEGEQAGGRAAEYVLGNLSVKTSKVPVRAGQGVRYVTPREVYAHEPAMISLRVSSPGMHTTVRITNGEAVILEKKYTYTNPAEMIRLDIPVLDTIPNELTVTVI
jgi:NADPH-dependent 2,4-dienoyl-CoA reductase/sulfur reductase-like enzyme